MNDPTMPDGHAGTADETADRPGNSPIVLVNTFTPKPGRLEEFIRTQVAEAARLGDAARAMGWIGNRIYRTHDGRAVIVTMFASSAARDRWAASAAFAAHRMLIEPLLEGVASTPCDLVAANGDV